VILARTGTWTAATIIQCILAFTSAVAAAAAAWAATESRRVANATGVAVDVAKQELVLATQQAKSSEDMADAAKSTLEASYRPLIIDVPYKTPKRHPPLRGDPGNVTALVRAKGDEDEVLIEVPVRNIGPGPATIAHVQFQIQPEWGDETELSDALIAHGSTDADILAPNESTILTCALTKNYPAFEALKSAISRSEPKRIEVHLTYFDILWRRGIVTVLYLRWANRWESTSVEITDEEGELLT
jgi:hypothetical protein